MTKLTEIANQACREHNLPTAIAIHALADAFEILYNADDGATALELREILINRVGHKGVQWANELLS